MFEDKVAIVTGSARGIGTATAWAFARRGAVVIIADIDPEGAKKIANDIRAEGLKAMAIPTDISKSDQVDNMVEKTLREFGRIDILVNNAAISGGYTHISEALMETWEKVIAVSLTGAFVCSRAVSKQMIKQHGGKIINISSMAGLIGSLHGGVWYSSAKAGIHGLTYTLAGDLAPYGINVNCIAPGLIATREYPETGDGWTKAKVERFNKVEVPLGRLGRPEEIAEVVVFLASDGASYITGQVICVNGGLMLGHRTKIEALLKL